MVTTRKLTLEEFLVLPNGETSLELVDGEAIPKMSPKRFHSRLTGTLYTLLSEWCQDRGEIGIEWGIVLKRHEKDWVPVPDLLYVSFQRLPLERFEDEACPVPPELAIEIISPDQSFGNLSEKATDYINAGVTRVWLVDPTKSITIFYPDAPPQTKRGEDTLADEYLPGLSLSVQQIFKQAGLA